MASIATTTAGDDDRVLVPYVKVRLLCPVTERLFRAGRILCRATV